MCVRACMHVYIHTSILCENSNVHQEYLTHFFTPRRTELYPVEINVAETSPRDSRQPVVVVLVYVDVEGRVNFDVITFTEWLQTVLYVGVTQPLLQLG